MKILLIRPSNEGNINTRLPESLNKNQGILPPLGILYIASFLEAAGYVVVVIDVIAEHLSKESLSHQINQIKPDIVGITTMTPTLMGALNAAQIAKKLGAITVLGGPHLSIFPKETLLHEFIDYGVHGDGEEVMLDLVNALEQGKEIDNIEGLIYKKNNSVYMNSSRVVENLDTLPLPAYHLVPMHKYSSIIGLYPISTMVTTRGCPYKCHFCFKQVSDLKLRTRSPKSVVDEMQILIDDYRVKEIMFYDDVITSRRDHIVGICEEILKRNLKIKWEAPSRVDCVDRELLLLMREAGCYRLRYGVESGNEEILRLMNKQSDLKFIKDVFALTKTIGIETFAYFIIGYIHDNKNTIRQTINYALELNPDLIMFTVAIPLPGTLLHDLAAKEGLIAHDYWKNFTLGDMRHQKISYLYPDSERMVKKAYSKFYLRFGYLLKQFKNIRSLYDLKMRLLAFVSIIKFKMNNE